MEKLAFDHFEKKIYIHSTKAELYKLWATQKGITTWFLEKAKFIDPQGHERRPEEFVQVGDTYTWHWHNWNGVGKGEILKANGMDYLEFSFDNSIVSVSFEEKNGVVIVCLKQFNIPEDEESILRIHVGCSNGWTFWLTNLKAYLEHGILLNETEIDLRGNELAGWTFVNM
ncbi:MAG: SRPBCC domain-containing protein [Bacteroidia bacterium]|nr:SRPBCC domain-containing protein [Bacteroidia bacterium]